MKREAIAPNPAVMKIAFVTTSYPLKADSVSGIFIYRLVDHLVPRVQITVITPSADHPVDLSEDSPAPVKIFRYAPLFLQSLAHKPGGVMAALKGNNWNYLILPFFCLAMFFSCLKAASGHDILHANWSANGVIAGLAGRLTRTPVLTTLRGGDVSRVTRSGFQRYLLRLCLALNCRVVTVSEAIYEQMTTMFPEYAEKLLFVPNGVEAEFIEQQPTHGAQELRLLTAGNLIAGKGIDVIIKALAEVSGRLNVRLSILGDGQEAERLQHLASSLELSEKVDFYGAVPPAEVLSHLANSDVFILASSSEGRSNALLEALAACKAVVATDIRGVAELIKDGDNGLLFTPGDFRGLAQKIELLAHNPQLRQQLAHSGRRFIIDSKLLWPETAAQYLMVYKEMLQ